MTAAQGKNTSHLKTVPHIVLQVCFLISLSFASQAASRVMISEFMARNSSTLADEDGLYPDWIELHNTTAATVNLEGWYLTDTTNRLDKWRIPGTNILANGYLVIFASGRNRQLPGAPLHTDFQLDGDGEYLALVMPDATTIATEFAPRFPPQLDDASYGSRQFVNTLRLITNGAAARFTVPLDGSLGTNWTGLNINDANWSSGRTGLGYSSNGIPPGLYSYWPIRESAGTVVSNLVAGGSPANIFGATWAQDAVRGTVLNFDGWSSHVSAGTIPRLSQAGSNFTWSFWHRHNGLSHTNAVILGNRSGGSSSPLQFVKFTPSKFEYYRGGDIGFIPYQLPVGSWRHLAVVKGGSSLHYYDNGTLIGAATAAGDIEANPLFWGGDPGAAGEYVNGSLDDISLWTTALTPSQISYLAAGASPLSLLGVAADIGTDVKAAIFGVNASLYVRVPFHCPAETGFNTLTLRLKYKDGFVAWLNGKEIARRNSPADPQWNSAAASPHAGIAATQYEDIDVSANLDLLQVGANVLAVHGLNLSANEPDFLILPELTGAAINDMGDGYFPIPTPGAVNNPGYVGIAADVEFDHGQGFYTNGFAVALNCPSPPGAVLRFTTNGTTPSLTNGFEYANPIPVNSTTVLRAAAFAPGYQTSRVGCQSYLFLANILSQTGAGFPATWGDSPADYAMDPRVVGSLDYAGTIAADMKSLPVLSIVLNPLDFFGPPPRGIYSTPTSQGVNFERPCSAEFFFPDGRRPGFQINAGVRIAGGASRSPALTPKHGLRLLFKTEYGASKLKYRFFEDSSLESFDTIQLRPNFNMSWVRTDNSGPLNNTNADGVERTHAIYVRDQFAKDTQRAMGSVSAHERFVHLYINGLYWGVYSASEHTDASFAAAYYGGDKSDYDAVFSDSSSIARAVDGDKNAWNEMLTLANSGLTNDAAYAAIQNYLDVTNLADYMLLNFYCCTVDWPWQNWNAARKRETNALFHFFVWDAEYALETPPWVPVDRTVVGTAANEADSPARLYHRLRQNAEWRLLFADRVQKHCFNGGALTTNAAIPRFLGLCDAVDRAVVGESARWGDVVRTGQPYTRNAEWLAEKNRLLTQFFCWRTDLVIQQFKTAQLYPTVPPPTLTPQGASFTNQMTLSLSSPLGTVYFTTNGVDPRAPGGAMAPGATPFAGPITLIQSCRVLARTFYSSTWSALNEALFFDLASPPRLSVTRTAAGITISWPPETMGYQLEYATEVTSVIWTPIPDTPGNTVTVPPGETRAFYRLRKF